ncbi:hypothetical protein [Myxococcus faecalis]|uniref:hypothetical protein n=1 Tax=Myxococcus faecalis TaxID=3115646 RepID=UPI003CFACB27
MPREPPIVLPVLLPLLRHANPWALLLVRAQDAVEGVAARQDVIPPGTPYTLAAGDKDVMLAHPGA